MALRPKLFYPMPGKSLSDMLLLGDHRLYRVADPVQPEEMDLVWDWVGDLHQVMEEVRKKYGFGRGIAAPQIGIPKRLIYINTDKPRVFVNPVILEASNEMFVLWDDCMCFPNLLVQVKRHRKIHVAYTDENRKQKTQWMEDDFSELFQ